MKSAPHICLWLCFIESKYQLLFSPGRERKEEGREKTELRSKMND